MKSANCLKLRCLNQDWAQKNHLKESSTNSENEVLRALNEASVVIMTTCVIV